jgi:hypothetical protein
MIEQKDKELLDLTISLGGIIRVTQDNQAQLQQLADQGMVQAERGSRYRITDAGRAAISNLP